MDRIKEIYNLPVTVTYEPNGITKATLTYKNTPFIGTATLHEDDKDMESKITGGTVAHMHVIIAVLKYEKQKAQKSLEYAYTNEIAAKEALGNYIFFRNALRKAYKDLNKYLKNQQRVFESIRIFRKGKSN